MLTRGPLAAAIVAALLVVFAAPAIADHGVAHNGETAEISNDTDLAQDDVVTVTGIGYAPGATLTVVQCFVFPAAGPTDCELSNYGQFTGSVGDDGTASVDYVVNVVPGRCDHEVPCFVVVSDGIGPDGNGVGMPVTFAAPADAEPEPEAIAEEEPAPEPEEEEPAPEPEEEEPSPEEEESAPEPAATADDDAEQAAAAGSDDNGGGSNAGPIIAVIAIAAVVLGGGGFLAMRGRSSNA